MKLCEFLVNLARRIDTAKDEANMTTDEMAYRLKWYRSVMLHLERGNAHFSLETINQIALTVEADPLQLLLGFSLCELTEATEGAFKAVCDAQEISEECFPVSIQTVALMAKLEGAILNLQKAIAMLRDCTGSIPA